MHGGDHDLGNGCGNRPLVGASMAQLMEACQKGFSKNPILQCTYFSVHVASWYPRKLPTDILIAFWRAVGTDSVANNMRSMWKEANKRKKSENTVDFVAGTYPICACRKMPLPNPFPFTFR